jgi:hypothetical protein
MGEVHTGYTAGIEDRWFSKETTFAKKPIKSVCHTNTHSYTLGRSLFDIVI